MQLKRKRSGSEFSHDSASTASTLTSPPRPNPFARPTNCTDSFEYGVTPPELRGTSIFHHIPGRTMKRTRDNRPSESEIHEQTLAKLYDGARLPEAFSKAFLARERQLLNPAVEATEAANQTSLHSFWNLSTQQQPSPAVNCIPAPQLDTPDQCEDCGLGLTGGDDDIIMEDVTGVGTACGSCRKHVCSHCSIDTIGDVRRCLACAGALNRGRTMTRTRARALSRNGEIGRRMWYPTPEGVFALISC